MIRDPAWKLNDFRVKDLSHSGAMACNLCLELVHFPLQPHQTSFIQHFPKSDRLLAGIIHEFDHGP